MTQNANSPGVLGTLLPLPGLSRGQRGVPGSLRHCFEHGFQVHGLSPYPAHLGRSPLGRPLDQGRKTGCWLYRVGGPPVGYLPLNPSSFILVIWAWGPPCKSRVHPSPCPPGSKAPPGLEPPSHPASPASPRAVARDPILSPTLNPAPQACALPQPPLILLPPVAALGPCLVPCRQ